MENEIKELRRVFILQSIKPRVETHGVPPVQEAHALSLSYNPSNQGLKQSYEYALFPGPRVSLSYNPSNQGLKHLSSSGFVRAIDVFILQSIKPRVETSLVQKQWFISLESLSYNPSNQGLKLLPSFWVDSCISVFILQSIKPRVETYGAAIAICDRSQVFILQSIKPRVETLSGRSRAHHPGRLYPTIHQTKGWNCRSILPRLMNASSLYPTIHQTKGWNKQWSRAKSAKRGVFILQSIKPRVETHL